VSVDQNGEARRIGVVVGLKSEAAAVRDAITALPREAREQFVVRTTGAYASRARAEARSLVREGVQALVSIGVSGALDPRLEPGAFLIARSVVDSAGRTIACSAEILTALGEAGPPAIFADVLGVDAVVASTAEKARLGSERAAAAVDMESHAVARAAEEAGRPFAVFRAIADPADRALPPSTESAIKPDGSVDVMRVMAALAGRPQDLGALIALGRDQAAALAALRGGLRHILPRLLLVV